MKKTILLGLLALCAVNLIFSQAPQSIPYQAVARDASGNLLVNQQICVQFTVKQGAGNTVVYQEYQGATTNKLGLFTMNLNSAASHVEQGSFAGINWNGGGAEQMQVDIDVSGPCTGSNTFTTMGTSPMQSVPYAISAGYANSATSSVTSPLSGNGTAASPLAVGYDNSSIKVNGSNQLYAPNTGTVTNIATNNGLTGGPITGTGTIGIATNGVTYGDIQKETNQTILGNNSGASASPSEITLGVGLGWNGANQIYNTSPSSGGTVTSIATNNGLTGGPITGTGTIGIATGGVTNSMLANSSLTIGTASGSGLTGGGSVSLGGSLALSANADNTTIKVNGSNQLYAVNTGTVTSVGLALPSFITVSNSPVTSSGILTGTLANQSANTIFAGPASGSAAAPAFRALTNADMPTGGAINYYNFSAANAGTSQWIELGTIALPQGGYNAFIEMHAGAGYNASNAQNGYVNLFIRTSNGSSVDANGFAASAFAECHGTNNFISNIVLVANAAGVNATAYTVYVYAGNYIGTGWYSIRTSGGTWTNSGTVSSPSGTTGSSTVCVATLQTTVQNTFEVANLAGTGYRPVYADASGNLYTLSGSGSNRKAFSWTGGIQTWQVPAGVNLIFVKLWGGGGGSGYSTGDAPGGGGGFVSGFLNVTPGSTLNIVVGGGGAAGTNSSSQGSSAYGGGGKAGQSYSGGGGGYSGIFNSSSLSQSTAMAIAGGGGGGSKNNVKFSGGGGGGLVGGGGNVYNEVYNSGTGGGQTFGGVTLTNSGNPNYTTSFQGSALLGGYGCTSEQGTPGGGGGWYGGGAGGVCGGDGGAGGGSNYISGFVSYMPIRNEQGGSANSYINGYTLNSNYLLQPGGTDGSDYSSGIGVGGYTVGSGNTGIAGGNGQVVIYW